MSTPDDPHDGDIPDLSIASGDSVLSAIEVRTTEEADLTEILLRLRAAGGS